MELLLARGADPNVTEAWQGQAAVMWAAAENHAPVVETLIAHGADPDAAATSGETALLFAVQLGHDAATRTLLAAGADVTVTSPAGAPLTHVAAAGGHHTLGPVLLDHGLDPNAVNGQGQSALHAIVEARRLRHQSRRTTPGPESFAFLERLVAAGAEVDARMVPPSRSASARPDEAEEVEEADEDAGASDKEVRQRDEGEAVEEATVLGLDGRTDLVEATPFLLAARSADLDAMRLLLEHGADPLASTRGGNTALTLASGVVFLEGGFGQFEGPPKPDVLEAVRRMLELGADVNAANDRGQTALHGAVYRGADDVVRFLVQAGARADAEDAAGRTPLRLAEEGFNQFASRIRRERSAEVLRELTGEVRARPRFEADAEVGR